MRVSKSDTQFMKHLIDSVPPGNWALVGAVCVRESNFCYAYTDTAHLLLCSGLFAGSAVRVCAYFSYIPDMYHTHVHIL